LTASLKYALKMIIERKIDNLKFGNLKKNRDHKKYPLKKIKMLATCKLYITDLRSLAI